MGENYDYRKKFIITTLPHYQILLIKFLSPLQGCSRTYLKLQLGCLLLTLLDCTSLGPRNAGTWVPAGYCDNSGACDNNAMACVMES